MSEYNTKNYTKQGGDVTVIGGTLEFGPDAKVTGLPAATKTETGGIKAVDNLEDCGATDVAGVNAFINSYLLARLREAGILKD
ncbi:MAG: Head fiber protein [Clostridia bacterium]|nr:Head fiber protein [Clostridia bacterium]